MSMRAGSMPPATWIWARSAAVGSWPHSSPARSHDSSALRYHSRSAAMIARMPSALTGVHDSDMVRAVRRLAELGGGIAVVERGVTRAELPLPVAGLLADAPLAEVIEKSLACNDAARELGWTGATPFLTLSFLALSVIPSLKITDRGLVDVDRFELVPLSAE